MHTHLSMIALQSRAAHTLKAVLAETSAVQILDLEMDAAGRSAGFDILARIQVYCHRYTLACKVLPGENQEQLCSTLQELSRIAPRPDKYLMPVIIAPSLSPRSQALCRLNNAGFVDLAGNARLELGEIFLATRSLPHTRTRGAKRSAAQKFPPARAEAQTGNAASYSI